MKFFLIHFLNLRKPPPIHKKNTDFDPVFYWKSIRGASLVGRWVHIPPPIKCTSAAWPQKRRLARDIPGTREVHIIKNM